jgi:hypothetical protein
LRLEALEAELAANEAEEQRLADLAAEAEPAEAEPVEAEAEVEAEPEVEAEEPVEEKKVMSAAEKKKWRQKKNKLLKKIKDQLDAGDLDEENASKIAS